MATDSSTAGHIPGMGKEPGNLQGSAFKLPDSVGLMLFKVTTVDTSQYCRVTGSGIFVIVGMELENNYGKDTTVVLPAGLTFHSLSDTFQNGLLVQELKIPLAKNGKCKTLLYLYCVNESRYASDETSVYELGPVTNAAPLVILFGMLKGKNI